MNNGGDGHEERLAQNQKVHIDEAIDDLQDTLVELNTLHYFAKSILQRKIQSIVAFLNSSILILTEIREADLDVVAPFGESLGFSYYWFSRSHGTCRRYLGCRFLFMRASILIVSTS
ncbi:uncharacterized protein G2W53_007233 [Senna tora]|uniref:Uncharacterized protein n=1 Tax=Senna tora TaxID=362788 RepID=A0A835CDE4_9FABA|nr:uncharacterized protein G2W53_007233 [Senna tora]